MPAIRPLLKQSYCCHSGSISKATICGDQRQSQAPCELQVASVIGRKLMGPGEVHHCPPTAIDRYCVDGDRQAPQQRQKLGTL